MHKADDRIWRPAIIGHRGASARAPENTAPAFDLALDVGADGLELDLQLSRDGEVVIYHDHKLGKLGLRSRHIRDYDWEKLATRDAGVWFGPQFAETPLLRLIDVLEGWGARTRLLLEIKAHGRKRQGSRDEALALASAQTVKRNLLGALENVAFLSFSNAVLEVVAKNFENEPEKPPCLVRNLAHPGELRRTRDADIANYSALCVNVDAFSPQDVRRIHRSGKALYAYTVDSVKQIRHAHSLGCSLLISNNPELVRERVLNAYPA